MNLYGALSVYALQCVTDEADKDKITLSDTTWLMGS